MYRGRKLTLFVTLCKQFIQAQKCVWVSSDELKRLEVSLRMDGDMP